MINSPIESTCRTCRLFLHYVGGVCFDKSKAIFCLEISVQPAYVRICVYAPVISNCSCSDRTKEAGSFDRGVTVYIWVVWSCSLCLYSSSWVLHCAFNECHYSRKKRSANIFFFSFIHHLLILHFRIQVCKHIACFLLKKKRLLCEVFACGLL